MKAIVIDTETNDKDNPEVIELAYTEIRLTANGIMSLHTVTSRYDCRQPIRFGAMATHHIFPDEIKGEPYFNPKLNAPVAEYYIGHNIDFDWRALGEPPVQRICTLAMARYLWPECDSHTISALMYYLFPEDRQMTRLRLRDAHNAMFDVKFTVEILWECYKKSGVSSLEELHAFSEMCRVPQIMTFGKFKGRPVAAVDNGWRSWYKKQSDKDPYLLQAFELNPYDPRA